MAGLRSTTSITTALALTAALAAAGCQKAGQPGAPKGKPMAVAADATQCAGTFSDGSTVSVAQPKLLPDVPGGQLFCDFHTFAWNQFAALTQVSFDPNDPTQNQNDKSTWTPLFLHWAPWYNMLPQSANPPAPGAFPGGSTQLNATPDLLKSQAGDGDQLIDQAGNATVFDIRFNSAMYQAVVSGNIYTAAGFDAACNADSNGNCTTPVYFPASAPGGGLGAVEIKTSWRDFLTAQACAGDGTFYCYGQFGLVGVHIVQKTATHGEWIWMSFEHVANAPDCAPIGDAPIAQNAPTGKPWSYFTATQDVLAAGACTVTYKTGGAPQCNSDPGGPTTFSKVNVCRTDILPGGGATPANCAVVQGSPTQDDSNSKGNVACLNASLIPQMASNRGGAWGNYKMVGSLWLRGATLYNEDFRILGFQQPATGVNDKQAVGFPHLANTTMETWFQDGSGVMTTLNTNGTQSISSDPSPVNPFGDNISNAGCFNCHSLPSVSSGGFRTMDLSHYSARLYTGGADEVFARLLRTDRTRQVSRAAEQAARAKPRPAGPSAEVVRGKQAGAAPAPVGL